MKVAHIKVVGTQIEVTDKKQITSGMVGATVEIEFSPEWKDLTKTVVFKAGSVSMPVLNPERVVEIPPEVLEKKNKQLHIGVSGFSSTGETVMPTSYGFINNITEGTFTRSLIPETSLTPMEQLQAQISAVESMVNQFLNDAANGKYDGETGPVGPAGPIGQIGPIGPRGVTFYAHQDKVDNGYRIYWTNDGGLTNPDPVVLSDYYHSEEFAALAKQVRADAVAAANSALTASGSSDNAEAFSEAASVSANNAKRYAENAALSAKNAKTSETNAEASKNLATESATQASRDAGQAKAEANRAKTEADRAAQAAIDATKNIVTAVISTEAGRLVCDMTSREIIDASRTGVAKAEYTDEATGETREYYYFKQLDDGRACFTKDGYIEDGIPKQALFYVDFAGNVEVETRTADIPTKTSNLANDSGFITRADVPTKTSQLTNDSGFVTEIPAPFDDSTISLVKGWSSVKIVDEIIHQGPLVRRWEDIQRIVRSGMAKKILRPGDIFNAAWTDPVSKKTYEIPWHIADIRNVITPKRETVEAAIIQQHKVLPIEVPFDWYEAFYVAKEKPLPPGTYHVVFAEKWGTYHEAGDAWSFTLTHEVPVGGLLAGFHDTPYSGFGSAKVESFLSRMEAAPIESVVPRKAAEGIKLAELTFKGKNGFNSIEKVCYGSNNYPFCYQRQWLNADGLNWWEPKTEYDLPPTDYKERYGFMTGWDPAFLSVCQPFRSVVSRNRDTDNGELDEVFDRFVLPSLEEMYIKKQVDGEGPFLPYWKDAIGLPEPREWYKDTPELVHIDINGTKRYARFRSAFVYGAGNAWFVSPSGVVGSGYARYRRAAAPLAAIY